VEIIMDKNYILELRNYILNKIVYFYDYYKNENIIKTSFSNWNVRDVIGHINSWLKYSEDKLESIKLKKSFEYVDDVDIEKFNRINYEKNKNESLDNIINESKILLEKYKYILDLFDEKEMFSEKFPTGFTFALWKYMTMDLIIHPIMHILYYFLKMEDYNEFIKEIENSKIYFMEYSENVIGEYNFKDFFENIKDKDRIFNGLKETIKNKNNEFINEIIKLNIE
jgi:hypothetical protein